MFLSCPRPDGPGWQGAQIFEVSDGQNYASVWFVSEIERDFKEFQFSLVKYMSGSETANIVNFRLTYYGAVWSARGRVTLQRS